MPELSFDRESFLTKYRPDFAMAYGSGVFQQEGYTEDEKPMVDIVMAVDDPEKWHRDNLLRNPEDYSAFARKAGPKFVAWFQEKAAGLYYNPFVNFEGQQVKYGVISTKRLVSDLLFWDSLYVAGRMQKPVHVFREKGNVQNAMQRNFESALRVALLLLPKRFTLEELFMEIAGFSYAGDIRTMVGMENPNKVPNIVRKNFGGFEQIYGDLLDARAGVTELNGNNFEQDKDPVKVMRQWGQLPLNVKEQNGFKEFPNYMDLDQCREILRKSMFRVVFGPTLWQSAKGGLTADPVKAVKYLLAKREKANRG